MKKRIIATMVMAGAMGHGTRALAQEYGAAVSSLIAPAPNLESWIDQA